MFLVDVITGDESWIFEYNLETELQRMKWHTPKFLGPTKSKNEQVG